MARQPDPKPSTKADLVREIRPPCGGVPFIIRVKDEAELAKRIQKLSEDLKEGWPGLPILRTATPAAVMGPPPLRFFPDRLQSA